MKKILIIIPNFESGGAERVHVNLANKWTENCNVAFVVMQKKGPLIKILNKKIKIFNTKNKRINELIFPLVKIFKNFKPDIVVSAMWPLTSISLISKIFAFSKFDIYFVEHCKLSGGYLIDIKSNNFINKLIIRTTYRFAKKIICVSECVKKDLISITNLSPSKFSVIFNPVYFNKKIQYNENNYSNFFKGSRYKVIGVGTLKKQKDFKTLIMSFALVIKKIDASLVIIGDGPEKNNLINLIKELNIGDKVTLYGFDNNTYPWFKTADLYVHSAIYDGLPLTILESLLTGTPVVSTKSECGPEEILEYGKFGELVEVSNVNMLAKAIVNKLVQDNDKNLLIKRASEFSLTKISNKYLELFNI